LEIQFFVENADRAKIIADISFESTPVWEKSRDVMGMGARYSTFEDMIKEIAAKQGWAYSEFPMANQGFFYRLDQLPFARHNIPSVWLSAGERFVSGKNHLAEFLAGDNYHTVKDDERLPVASHGAYLPLVTLSKIWVCSICVYSCGKQRNTKMNRTR